ncbi:MAG: hypothetical protein ACRECH_00050 [Nitrososphaerales archaeon]
MTRIDKEVEQMLDSYLDEKGLLSTMPRWSYYREGRKAFCWNTEPFSGDRRWRFWIYRMKGQKGNQSLTIVKERSFRKRKTAKAHALKASNREAERLLASRPAKAAW